MGYLSKAASKNLLTEKQEHRILKMETRFSSRPDERANWPRLFFSKAGANGSSASSCTVGEGTCTLGVHHFLFWTFTITFRHLRAREGWLRRVKRCWGAPATVAFGRVEAVWPR